MTTQYTPILKIALPVTGELSGTWGDVVNDNITSMFEQAIAGLATISTWSANSHTLTTANGTTSESRCAMLVAADGAGLAAAGEIICPAASKLYVLKNGSSYALTLKTAGGTGVAVAAGETAFLFCDGTNVNACVTTIINGRITGNLTVDGNATINGNTTLGNATSDTITATARFASDLVPSTDNARDLGSTGNSWKDLYIDGTGYLALVDINGGTIDGVSIGASTAATIINVDNLRLDGNTISSTDTNGNVVIAPNGTGDVQLDADTVRVGDSGAATTLTSNGAGALTITTGGAANLTLSTNNGTNSGTIVINNGATGTIALTPDTTGDVHLVTDTVRIGDPNTDAYLTTNGTGNLNLTTNEGTNSGTIQIAQGANASISLTPNGTGTTVIKNPSINGTTTFNDGTANGVIYLNGSKQATAGSALTFDGSTLTVTGGASVVGTSPVNLQRPVIPSFAGQGAPAIQWQFYSTGTTYTTGAYIQALADAAWSSTSAPTSLRFYTTPSGSTSQIESMRTDANGMFIDTGTGGGRMTFSPGATRNQILSTTTGFGAYNILRNQASSYEWLNAAGTQVMTLSTGGNFALGGTDTSNGRINVVAGTGATGNSLFLTNVDGTYNPYMQFQHNGINGVTILCSSSYGGTAGNLTINNAGTATAVFNSSGNTGLRCVPSAWTGNTVLELFNPASAIRGDVYQGAVGGNNVTGLSHNAYFDGTDWKTIYTAATYYASRYEQTSGEHAFYVAGLTNGTISFTKAATIDGSSRLLLGTTTARNRLTVQGTVFSTPTLGTASGQAFFGEAAGYGTMIGTSGFGYGWIQQQRVDGTATAYALILQPVGGSVYVNRINAQNNGKLEVLADSGGQAIVAQVQSNGNSLFQGFSSSGGSAVFQVTGNGALGTNTVDLYQGALTFPATQVASSNANTLDDYEEGTWTPVLYAEESNTGSTYAVQDGRYTKIGNMVYIRFGILINVLGGGGSSGAGARIYGLPFTNLSISYGDATGTMGGTCFTATESGLAVVANGASWVSVRSGNGASTDILKSDFGNGTFLFGSFFYNVS